MFKANFNMELLLSIALLALTSCSPMSNQDAWDATDDTQVDDASWINKLDYETQSYLHVTADQVPAFPLQEYNWDDINEWPEEIALDGKTYTLRLEKTYSDYSVIVKDKKDASVAHYMPNTPRPFGWAGPFYVWWSDGAIKEMSYTWIDTGRTFSYVYYPRGILREFSYDLDNQFINEYYARNGHLVGFRIDHGDGQSSSESLVMYWKGVRVPDFRTFLFDYVRPFILNESSAILSKE